MSLLGKVAKSLDKATGSASTRMAVNALISKYGKLTDLLIDTQTGKLSASVKLKGEATPISVTIDKYELIRDRSKMRLLIRAAASDKEWLDLLLQDYVVGRSLKVPDDKIKLVEEMLG